MVTLNEVEPYNPEEFEPADVAAPAVTYDAPELPTIETGAAPEYKAPEVYAPAENATVEGRLTGLLDSDSKYIRSARNRGMETANQRGLLNSSIAAGSAERSAVESALPIASQDAKAFSDAGMAGYQGEIEGAKATQKYGADVGVIQHQAKASSLLSSQVAEQNAALAVVDASLKSGLSAQEALQKGYQSAYDAAIAAGLSAQEAQQTAELQMYIEGVQQEGAMERLALELTTGEMENATRLIRDFGESYADQIMRVNADPNINAANKSTIIADLRYQYEQNVKIVNDIYGVGIQWVSEATDEGRETAVDAATEQTRLDDITSGKAAADAWEKSVKNKTPGTIRESIFNLDR